MGGNGKPDDWQDPNDPLQGEIRGTMDLARIQREIEHPEFSIDAVVYKQLANKLYLIFENKLPGAPTRVSKNGTVVQGEWSERARLMAARIISALHGHNVRSRPRQHDHRHAHLHMDASQLADEIDALAAEKLKLDGQVE